MINLDDRALFEWDENEMFFMLHLTRRLNADDSCFPAIQTIANDTKWSKRKVLQVKSRCIEKGILSSTARFDDKGSQKSNLYTVKTNMLAVYVNMQGKGGEEGVQKTTPPPCKKRTSPHAKNDTPTHAKNAPLSISELEVLNNEVLESTHTPKSFETQSEKESDKIEAPAAPIAAIDDMTTIRDSETLETTLLNLYRTDAARLERVKMKFSTYKTQWTKSGMIAAISKFSDYHFAKDGALPIYGTKKADTLFCSAVIWLCREVKDYKDEPIATESKTIAQNQDLSTYLNNINKQKRDEYNTKKENRGILQ